MEGFPLEAYVKYAKQLIEINKYLVLSTCSEDSQPWATPLFYAYDKDYIFYFLSDVTSRHAQNIEKNPKVGLVIFDSHSELGSSDEVQISGTAEKVPEEKLESVARLYSKRLFPDSNMSAYDKYDLNKYGESSEFRFFSVKIAKVFVNGMEQKTQVELKS